MPLHRSLRSGPVLAIAIAAAIAPVPASAEPAATVQPEPLPARAGELAAPIAVRQVQRVVWPIRAGNAAPPPFRPRGPGASCPSQTTSLAANFDTLDVGSEITLQAGMVQGEGFAQTYIVPDPNPATPVNEAFPIEINLVEVITATLASVSGSDGSPITVGWTIEVYDGEPVAGAVPVFTVDSTDDQANNPDLPPDISLARVPGSVCSPCGTTNLSASVVKLQFSVDAAADPADRIVILGNDAVGGVATGRFTVAFILRQMNDNAPFGACSFGIVNQCGPLNRCTNAFMATESNSTGTLNFASRNWGIFRECGPFACAGGTYRFSQLSAGGGLSGGCRPSRDTLMQVTYTPAVCTLIASGACCDATGVCTVTTQSACASGYQGNGTVCAPNPCPQPSAACCINGVCDLRTESACLAAGGVYQGSGSTCQSANCLPAGGACCFAGGICQPLTQPQCAGFSGTYQGNGTVCGPNASCPVGACCWPDGTCVIGRTPVECRTLFNGTFQGTGTTCQAVSCPIPTGACCAGTGFCALLAQAVCLGVPGTTWQGPGTACEPVNPCAQTGLCCRGATCASGVAPTACVGSSGAGAMFIAGQTLCNAAGATASPCCYADFDKLGGRTVDDIFVYLNAWFANSPFAKVGGDGVATPTVDDIFVFLNAWFAGCN
jgi:hypothetical protein